MQTRGNQGLGLRKPGEPFANPEATVIEERLKLAVFIDFDNIEIGVRDTLGKDFDVALVLEALKDRGELVTKFAYGDWHRHGDPRRQMAQHAVQMVQRTVNPRGDKNAADINLALDALEMAFTRHHINAFVIVGGDSDYMPLVEKLKEYDKRVLVVGGREFTSQILQKNCHEFIAYENLLEDGGAVSRPGRGGRGHARGSLESRSPLAALPSVERALKILAEREVAPQLGLLKSTILQLDPTFSEREYGARSFLEFIQKLERAGRVRLRRSERSYLVERVEGEVAGEGGQPPSETESSAETAPAEAQASGEEVLPLVAEAAPPTGEARDRLRQALDSMWEKAPDRPLYLRQILQALRAVGEAQGQGRQASRAALDLLHQAQREGCVKLQRDRHGVLRVFRAPQAVPRPAEPAPEIAVGETLAETAPEPPTETAPIEAPPPAEPAPKPRRRRAGSAPRRVGGRRR